LTPALPGPSVGNALVDGPVHRGWIVGHFMPKGDLRLSSEVEIKWGVHRAGEERATPQGDEVRTTVILLVSCRFRITLDSEDWVLTAPGDYAMWGPGTGHSWHAEEDSQVITVRWPSPEESP